MTTFTFKEIKEAIINKNVHVLEYQGDEVVDVTGSMVGFKNAKDYLAEGTDFELHLLMSRNGEFEQVLAHPVYTGKGLVLFIEDTLGTLGVSYIAV